MENFIGRSLFDKLREEVVIDEAIIKKIMIQVARFLKYLHTKKIVYRDLKLENIYYDGENIKIMDFAYSIFIRDGKYLKDGIGIPYYVSPEMIKGKYNKKTDIWSYGVMLYMMLKGVPPFIGSS